MDKVRRRPREVVAWTRWSGCGLRLTPERVLRYNCPRVDDGGGTNDRANHRARLGFSRPPETMDRSTPTTTRTTRRPSETTDERDPSTRIAGYRHRRQGSPLRSIGLDRRQAIVARPTRGASMRRDDDRRRAWACTRDARARVSCRGSYACARETRARRRWRRPAGEGRATRGCDAWGSGWFRALTRETRRDATRRDARGEILTVRLFFSM